MSSHKFISSRSSSFLFALAVIAALSMPMCAQDAHRDSKGADQSNGMPEDWSHHHLVFSDPGTEEDAIRNGTHDRWSRVVNDPRFILQRAKHRVGVGAFEDRDGDARWEKSRRHSEQPPPLGSGVDWSMALGSGSVSADVSPAKYNFDINATPDCTNDFVVFPINANGPSIVAFNNLYTGTSSTSCGVLTTSTVMWAFSTGHAIPDSPVLSLDGKTVAFVDQPTIRVAPMHISLWSFLRWKSVI